MIDKLESKLIDAMRCIAIFMAVLSHSALPEGYFSPITAYIVKGGVAIFFFLSGYLFSGEKVPFGRFVLKNLKRLVLPWVLTGSAVYLYTVIRHGTPSVLGFVRWLVGFETYLWYMLVTLVLYLIFYFVNKSKIAFWIIPVFSVANIFILVFAVDFLIKYDLLYVNVFNWILYFWLGSLLKRKSSLSKLYNVCKRFRWLIIAGYIASVLIVCFTKYKLFYWSFYYPLFMMLVIAFAISFSSIIYDLKAVRLIGQVSFSIYLLHMPIAGIAAFISNKLMASSPALGNIFDLLSAPLTIMIVTSAIWLYVFIARKLKWVWAYDLIGVPKRIDN